jgi:hypothetical protein
MRIITAWQQTSPEVTMMGFKKCCTSSVMDEMDDYVMLWNGSEGDGNVRTVRKMKALTVKMERVTVIGKCR